VVLVARIVELGPVRGRETAPIPRAERSGLSAVTKWRSPSSMGDDIRTRAAARSRQVP
jgi:hypothetical protein